LIQINLLKIKLSNLILNIQIKMEPSKEGPLEAKELNPSP
jgi:hypothetical protein